jgi:hypothetical protein
MGVYSSTILVPKNRGTEEEIKYKDYIKEHIQNVKDCFEMYENQLCRVLKVDNYELKENILVHDNSKFSIPEFEAYRQYFYPKKGEEKDKDVFNFGWLLHENKNPHHPEFWVLRDGKKNITLDMPDIYIAEMLLDWAAMGIKFNDTAYSYYQKSGADKPFSDNTIKKVESVIEIFK